MRSSHFKHIYDVVPISSLLLFKFYHFSHNLAMLLIVFLLALSVVYWSCPKSYHHSLIALFLIFFPHVQKSKKSLIFQIYFQQSSAKVTKKVCAEKASRGGSA